MNAWEIMIWVAMAAGVFLAIPALIIWSVASLKRPSPMNDSTHTAVLVAVTMAATIGLVLLLNYLMDTWPAAQ